MKLLIIITLLNSLCLAQVKSGEVFFEVVIVENKESKLDELMLSLNPKAHSICKEFEFVLSFSKEKSFFKLTDKLYSDTDASKIGLLKTKYHGAVLQQKDTTFQEYSIERLGDYILKKPLLQNWNTTNEFKMIDGYKCYKATNILTVVNSIGTFHHPITAWYCPQIPFSFGPNGFGGLPGLILELQTKDYTYGAKKITLSDQEIKIGDLKKYKIINETELNLNQKKE